MMDFTQTYNDLEINGVDAKATYGITMDSEAMSAFMTPAPQKAVIENKSRLQHGTRVINNPRKDEREVTIVFNLCAKNMQDFITKYNNFCENVLATGNVQIRTRYLPNVKYKFLYLSCSQFTEFMFGMAKFTLKLREPNPSDRSI